MSNLNNFKFNSRVKNTNSHVGKRKFVFIESEKNFIKKCTRCGTDNELQRHHVFPRRFFGRQNNEDVIILCKNCHIQIELLIPKYVKLSQEWYDTFTKYFISQTEK